MFAQCINDFAADYGLPLSLFLGGLVGGFTHCAGMCSPFVLAQTENTAQKNKIRNALILPYHLGRMTTYVALAVLVSGFINLAFLYSDLKMLVTAPLLFMAGVIFLVTALPQMAAVFPWISRLHLSLPYGLVSKAFKYLGKDHNPFARYGMGLVMGFMPCGLVVAALMASAGAQTPVHAALAMGAFAIGTMPALFLVGLGGQALTKKFPQAQSSMKQTALIVSGVWLFILAGSMVF